MQFAYEPKAASDRRTLFAGGMALTSSQQLKTISMFGPESALVREYRFAYKTGVGTGRTVLRNIKECAADDTCKPRTTFAWYGGKPGFERIATPIKVPQSHLVAPMMLDVTGDGLDDLVVPTVPWNAAAHSDISHDGLDDHAQPSACRRARGPGSSSRLSSLTRRTTTTATMIPSFSSSLI